jgi:hypothetical protein
MGKAAQGFFVCGALEVRRRQKTAENEGHRKKGLLGTEN